MKNEYIAGDLVKYLSQVVKIVEVYQDGTCYFGNETMCGQQDCKDAEPIPLTTEILEKNGWRKEQENYFNDSYHIFLETEYEKYSAFKVVHNNVVWLRDVRNVSDLQHLLFGLGLNSEMEV